MKTLRRRYGHADDKATRRALREVEPGLRGVASRMAQAEENFIDNVARIGGISKVAAAKVLAVYHKHKIVKMNAVSGEITVKHGAFLDRAVILRALSEAT